MDPFRFLLAFFLGAWFFMGLLFLVGIASFIFWIVMVVDVARRQFKKPNDKVAWVLIVILAGAIGAVVYYFMVKRK